MVMDTHTQTDRQTDRHTHIHRITTVTLSVRVNDTTAVGFLHCAMTIHIWTTCIIVGDKIKVTTEGV